MMGTGSYILYKKVLIIQYPNGANPIAIIRAIYFDCVHVSGSKLLFLANAQKEYVDFSKIVAEV